MDYSQSTEEAARCPLCGCSESILVCDGLQDRLHSLPGKFRLVRCRHCHLVYQNPRLCTDELALFYPDHYESFVRVVPWKLSLTERMLVKYGLSRRKRIVDKYAHNGGRLLDIGCGTGLFLAEMAKNPRWCVEGIEPNFSAANFAKTEFGLVVHNTRVEQASLQPNSYTAITLWDVIEHLANPVDVMHKVREWLEPRGYVFIRTPQFGSLGSLIFRDFWAGLDAPRHLVLFTQSTIRFLLDITGFEVVEILDGGGSHDIFILSMRFLATKNERSSFLWVALIKFLRSIWVRAALSPVFWTLGKLGLNDEMLVVARVCRN